MPPKKQNPELVKKAVIAACEVLRSKGESVTVPKVATIVKKSCRDIGKYVAEWKELHESNQPETVYTELEKDLRGEVIRLQDKLVTNVADRRVSEEKATWETRIANVRNHKAEDLEAAFAEVDFLREQVKDLKRKNTDLAKRLRAIQSEVKAENLMELTEPKNVGASTPDDYASNKDGKGGKSKAA